MILSNLRTQGQHILSALLLSTIITLIGCNPEKEEFDTSTSTTLSFSQDTITFDTIFTTVGSATKRLVVYNHSNKAIKISSVSLGGKNSSFFSLNVDGTATNDAKDVEIFAHDSMFVFVKVLINPNNDNNPLLVSDSIRFTLNGNVQYVQLVACGQDAKFVIADTKQQGLPMYKIVAAENETVTWTAEKPIVIYGYAVIDSAATLNIEQGARIYLHNGAGIWVYKGGCIHVNGSQDSPVTFQSDRTEKWYANASGLWDRIYINDATKNSTINYAIIDGAFIGLQVEPLGIPMGANMLTISNCTILNSSGAGLLASTYHIRAFNTIIANSKEYAVGITGGGIYEFAHNTFANTTGRTTPLFYFSNAKTTEQSDGSKLTTLTDLNLSVSNTIIYGNNTSEIGFDRNENVAFNYIFDHCLLRYPNNPNEHFVDCIYNLAPIFVNQSLHNYQPRDISPANAAGKYMTDYTIDMRGQHRLNPPSIGAIEAQVTE